VLGHYARDLGLLGLPQAVFKITGGAAMALGLADRGIIAEGNAADLVIFDPEKIIDSAAFDEHTARTPSRCGNPGAISASAPAAS
jgi:N-acyl-D-amino-acid deacylase